MFTALDRRVAVQLSKLNGTAAAHYLLGVLEGCQDSAPWKNNNYKTRRSFKGRESRGKGK